MHSFSNADLDLLFTDGRTYQGFLDTPIDDSVLKRLYALASLAPTSANSSPMRVVFVRTLEGKERLKPALAPMNVAKTMSAPVTAIIAHDLEFYEQLPKLSPHADFRSKMITLPKPVLERIALQSATLEAAFLIAAARALGLDCGPMGGFDTAKVDEAFFSGGNWRSNLLINLGYGDKAKLHPRNPRLSFEEAARLA